MKQGYFPPVHSTHVRPWYLFTVDAAGTKIRYAGTPLVQETPIHAVYRRRKKYAGILLLQEPGPDTNSLFTVDAAGTKIKYAGTPLVQEGNKVHHRCKYKTSLLFYTCTGLHYFTTGTPLILIWWYDTKTVVNVHHWFIGTPPILVQWYTTGAVVHNWYSGSPLVQWFTTGTVVHHRYWCDDTHSPVQLVTGGGRHILSQIIASYHDAVYHPWLLADTILGVLLKRRRRRRAIFKKLQHELLRNPFPNTGYGNSAFLSLKKIEDGANWISSEALPVRFKQISCLLLG